MTTITLQQAFKLLQDCSAVTIDCPMDGTVFISPDLDTLNGKPDNEFVSFFWEDSEGQEHRIVCHEETNAEIQVHGTSMFLSMFLKDEDGEDFEVILLQPMILE